MKISRDAFLGIVDKDRGMMRELAAVIDERRKNREDILKNPYLATVNRKLLDLNRDINTHLDIISQCIIDTGQGGALLATMPGSRYPYVYPRDSACASRFLHKLTSSPLKAGETAFRILGEIARFILGCQREDGYWGQRYGINGEDKAIYIQEDNIAHGVAILCRYLLAAVRRGVEIPQMERFLQAIHRGFLYSTRNYYRNEIHLFYSTTSIHESAIEEGYSIWVNYAYLLMLRLMEGVGKACGAEDRFGQAVDLKNAFEGTTGRIFTMSGRYVRRLKPNGEIDLRPDITLMSPFFFGTGLEVEHFENTQEFSNSIQYHRADSLGSRPGNAPALPSLHRGPGDPRACRQRPVVAVHLDAGAVLFSFGRGREGEQDPFAPGQLQNEGRISLRAPHHSRQVLRVQEAGMAERR